MSDRPKPSRENANEGQGEKAGGSTPGPENRGGFWRRLANWLAPPRAGEVASGLAESAGRGPHQVSLTLPEGQQIRFMARELRRAGDALEIAVSPRPDNTPELLAALRSLAEGHASTSGPGQDSDDYPAVDSDDSYPSISEPVDEPAARVAPAPEDELDDPGRSFSLGMLNLKGPADPEMDSLDVRAEVTPLPSTGAGAATRDDAMDALMSYGNVGLTPESHAAPAADQARELAPEDDDPMEVLSASEMVTSPASAAPRSPSDLELKIPIAALDLNRHVAFREEDVFINVPAKGAKPIIDDLTLDLPPPVVEEEKRPGPRESKQPPAEDRRPAAPAVVGRASPLVGFDFGTSYSSVAFYHDGFKLIEDDHGEVQMPSVVSFPAPDHVMIGSKARERMAGEAQWTITSPKRLLGRPYKDPKVGLQVAGLAFRTFAGSDKFTRFEAHDKIHSVGDICAMILTEMRERASKYLGCKVSRAVFAVPVSHGSIQRSALELAARQAGIEVVSLLTEPSASLLAHGIRGRKGIVAVYDFGGGTFDFCVLKVHETAFQVLCAGGEPWLGGDDFDSVMANHIAELFCKEIGIDLRSRAVELQALLFACEGAKRALSRETSADIRLENLIFTAEGKRGLRYRLSRNKFNKLTGHLVKKSILISEKVLAQAGLKPEQVDSVVMSGGTAFIPLVRDEVAAFFGKKPLMGEPDLAVVKGAALRAAELDGLPIDATSLSGRTLREVAGRTIGAAVKDGPLVTLIKRDSPLPVEVSHTFHTQKHNQTSMTVGIYEEAQSSLDADSKSIGQLRYKGIRPGPKGQGKIDFNFLLDEDGMLHVTATVEGKEFHKTIKLSG